MPTSIDPQPAENEFECARCGARVYYEMTRCPNCGVNLYEPEDDGDEEYSLASSSGGSQRSGMLDRIGNLFHRLMRKPYRAEVVFGDVLDQAVLYNDLLLKTGGDHATVERLIDFEHRKAPQATRMVCLQNAIQRWEQDNRTEGRA